MELKEHIYQLKKGTSSQMLGSSWFGCSCGASGGISEQPEVEWKQHKEAALAFESVYRNITLDYPKYRVIFKNHEIRIKKGER